MRLKRHRHGFRPARACSPHNLAEHMCVRKVNSVEVPHAEERRAKNRRNVFEFVKNLHSSVQCSVTSGQKASALWTSLTTDHWPRPTGFRFQTPASAHHEPS